MSGSILEKQRRLGVTDEFDVVVVGGGIAGVSAAVAAARCGASVCLMERLFALGGLATLGNIVVYLPLCDGNGNQVIKGLGEELLKLSVHDEPHRIPACWRRGGDKKERASRRYLAEFNPATYMLAMEELVVSSGVSLRYDTRFCDVVRKGGKITAIIVEDKAGRSAIKCKTVIDASGDADVCARAGEVTQSLATNVRAGWYYYTDGQKQPKIRILGDRYDPSGLSVFDGNRGYAGEVPSDVSAQVIDSRKLLAGDLRKLAKEVGKPVYPTCIATMADFRMTRRLVTNVELSLADDHRWFDDAVGMTGDWRNAGPAWYIPYRSLMGVETNNLLAVGRCMSVAINLWEVTRVIPPCAVTGEAAGTAAAMAVKANGGNLKKLSVPALQERLRRNKVCIDRGFAK